MSPFRRVVQALTVVVSAYYALWACAPAATLRPMTLDVGEHEFGLGAAVTGPTGDGTGCGTELLVCQGGLNGQLWYQHRFGERFSLGGTIFGGQSSFVGAGVQARFHWVETDRFRFGTDLEGGWLWAAAGLPVSFKLLDAHDLWLYSGPSFGFRSMQPLRVPLGVAWGIQDGLWAQAEFAWGMDPLAEPIDVNASGFWMGSLAASVRF